MISLSTRQETFLQDFFQRASTQSIIEDLMLMYSSYVTEYTNPENFDLGKEIILDIQSKLFTVQSILELIAVLEESKTRLKVVS